VAKSRARQAWIGGPLDERKAHRRRKTHGEPRTQRLLRWTSEQLPLLRNSFSDSEQSGKKDMPGRSIPGADRGRGVASFGAERRQKGAVSEARGTVFHFFCRVTAAGEGRWNGGDGEGGAMPLPYKTATVDLAAPFLAAVEPCGQVCWIACLEALRPARIAVWSCKRGRQKDIGGMSVAVLCAVAATYCLSCGSTAPIHQDTLNTASPNTSWDRGGHKGGARKYPRRAVGCSRANWRRGIQDIVESSTQIDRTTVGGIPKSVAQMCATT
jgi:hypothetical protein